jgi:enterochelin esterase-like enzyme
MDYRIYLPPCYDQQPQRRYPSLYLFHGQGSTDDQWDRLGADDSADKLIAAGEIPPLLIIMPHDRYGGEPDQSPYAEAILNDLIPYIEKTYRTIPDRTHRAVGGLSRGAGWAVHLAIADWKHFSALGAHSPAIFYYDAERMRTLLDAIPDDSYPRIYIDIGNRDRPEIMRVTLWFENLLNDRSIPHEWRLFTGYHSEEYWSAHMDQYLRWYTQDW